MGIEHIFRAYDVRGVANVDLTADVATRIGMAYGTFLQGEGRICIGRDVRTSSPLLANAMAAGLASTGVDVVSIGLVPIPVANFYTWRHDFDGGVYITASHNPAEYNGIRLRHSDGTGFTDENKRIKSIFEGDEFALAPWDEIGTIYRIDRAVPIDEFSSYLASKVSIERPLKAVLDLGTGAGALVAPILLRKLGLEVVTLHAQLDGTFPGRPSEPNRHTLGDLMTLIKEVGADFGVGYDGDGDRCMFVDDRGRIVPAEKVGVLLAKRMLEEKEGPILANVSCSMIIEEELEPLGADVRRTRVGDVFIAQAIKETGAILAVETSAHFFVPTGYVFDDPYITTLRLAEYLGETDAPFSELADAFPSYPFLEKNFKVADAIKFDVVEALSERYRNEGRDLTLIDGVKVRHEDGWVLLRCSNTQPLIRMIIEARSEATLAAYHEQYKKELLAAVDALK